MDDVCNASPIISDVVRRSPPQILGLMRPSVHIAPHIKQNQTKSSKIKRNWSIYPAIAPVSPSKKLK
jgi:hypothetical protein